jgi:hypothetical protein
MPRPPFRKLDLLKKFVEWGLTQRLAFIDEGDSNEIKDGFGNYYGIAYAMAMIFRHFGTGVVPARSGPAGHPQVATTGALSTGNFAALYRNGAPAALEALVSASPGGNIATISANGTIATCVLDRVHGLINGAAIVDGTGNANLNGDRTITVVDDYTFTFPCAFTIGAITTGNVLQIGVRGGWRFPYVYGPSGTFGSGSTPTLMQLNYLGSPSTSGIVAGYNRGFVDLNEALEWRATSGTFDSGAGKFKWQIRRNNNADVLLDSETSTNQGAIGLVTKILNTAASPGRNDGLQLRFTKPGNTDAIGPIFFPWNQAYQVNRTTGVALTCGMAWGGASTWQWYSLWGAAQAAFVQNHLARLMYEAVQPALAIDQQARLVVRMQTNLNERNQAANPSWATGITPGNSKAAIKENHAVWIALHQQAWASLGFAPQNLIIILDPCQRVNFNVGVDDANLELYADAMYELAGEMANVAYAGSNRDIIQAVGDDSALSDGGDVMDHLVKGGYQDRDLVWLAAIVGAAQAGSGVGAGGRLGIGL